ncbi:MAG: hypothetical protein GW823_08245 [Bacteroidetes bacterium]|nr:hypothetical protein [Bacteroidota bacterium]
MILNFVKKNSYDLKNFFLFSFGSIVASFFGYLTTREINSGLSEIEFGKFSYYYSILQLVFVFLSLNLYSTYIRFNNAGVSESLLRYVKGYTWIATVLFALIIYLLTSDLFLCCFSFILVYYERTYFYRSVLNTTSLNILTVLTSIILYLFCKYYFSTNSTPDHLKVLRFYGFGYLLSVVFVLINDKKKYITSNVVISFPLLLKYCLPLIGVTIIEWVLNFSNQYIIKNFLGFEELAKYAMAFRALFVLRFASSIFLLYFPMVYFRDIAKRDFSKINFIRSAISTILILLTMVMFFMPQMVYAFMGGNKYIDSVNLFRILLIADFLRIIASFYGIVLTYEIKTQKTLYIQLLGALVNLALSLIFINKYGVIGAAIANFVACFTIFLITYFYSRSIERKYITY